MSSMTRRLYYILLFCHLAPSFLATQIASPILCSSFEDRQMSDYISDEGCICLIRCFLEPSHRLCKGSSNPGDRLYQLFDPYKTEELGM